MPSLCEDFWMPEEVGMLAIDQPVNRSVQEVTNMTSYSNMTLNFNMTLAPNTTSPPGLSSGNRPPSLTQCAQDTVLVWTPLFYLLLILPMYVYSLRHSRLGIIPRSPLHITKQVLCVLLLGTLVIQLGGYIHDAVHEGGASPGWHAFMASVLQAITMVVVMFTLELERRRGTRSSIFLLIFWFIVLLDGFLIIWSQAVIYQWKTEPLRWTTSCIYYGIALVQLILCLMVDSIPQGGSESMHQFEVPNPFYYASSITKLCLLHAFALVRKGYKKSIELSDVWDLEPKFYAEKQLEKFKKQWEAEKAQYSSSETNTLHTKVANGSKADIEGGIPLLKMPASYVKKDEETEEKTKKNFCSRIVLCCKENKPSLIKSIVKSFAVYYLLCIVFRALIAVIVFINPVFIRKIIRFIEDENASAWNGYLYAMGLLLVSVVRSVLSHYHGFLHFSTNLRVRNAMMSAIYEKALKLSTNARKDTTVGEIVNLMSVDAHRYGHLIHFMNFSWVLPMQCGMALYFLWDLLGPSALAGLSMFIFQAPINFFIAKMCRKLQNKQMKYKDQRIKLTNEVLSGIKVLKLYAWEKSFEAQIQEIRQKEIQVMRLLGVLHSILHFIFTIIPFLISLISFAVYVFSSPDNILTAEKAFVSLAYYDILRGPLQHLPHFINMIIETHVSHSRIYKFLMKEELDPECVNKKIEGENSVEVKNGFFGWNPDEKPLLQNIQMKAKRGSMVAIVGGVGAGKSSILSALMGEMHKFKGTIKAQGEVAYVPQQAWIQQATLRKNILFNNDYEEKRYNEVLDVCALRPDLEILPGGDQTEIGEKGINLSGGQKLRVSLARAVYQMADLYLLDDPLSAVDAHVGKTIFEKVLGPKGMLKEKTRVIVTHALWFLSMVDEIFVIENGRIAEHGSYTELMAKNQALAELMRTYDATKDAASKAGIDNVGMKGSQSKLDPKCSFGSRQLSTSSGFSPPQTPQDNLSVSPFSLSDSENDRTRTFSAGSRDMPHLKRRKLKTLFSRQVSTRSTPGDFSDICPERHSAIMMNGSVGSSKRSLADIASQLSLAGGLVMAEEDVSECISPIAEDSENGLSDSDLNMKQGQTDEEKGELVGDEEMERGKVKMSVYTSYLKAVGLPPGLAIFLLAIIAKCMDLGSSFWLSRWSDDMTEYGKHMAAMNDVSNVTTNDTAKEAVSVQGVDQGFYLGIFALLGFFEGFTSAIRQVIVVIAGLRTSKVQHNRLLHSVLRAPMEFFDRTPLGRILNRFSSDVGTVDSELPHQFMWFMVMILEVVGSVALVGIITPFSLIAFVTLGVIFFWIQSFYVATQRQAQRLQSVTKSPIYAHFGESLAGMSTIRAYSRQGVFLAECQKRINQWSKCDYFSCCAHKWLWITLSMLGSTIVFVTAMMLVGFRDSLTAGLVGLSLAYAAGITDRLAWTMEIMANLESNTVSVERLLQFIGTKPEAEWEIEAHKPAPSWPNAGKVTLDKLCNRYREGLDLVLKGISCNIKPAEKVGIVGRTGAGKSSLTLSLFRIIEAAEGSITIDDIDISTLGLHDLRSKLTIIPQDPVLFSGKLRMNLDPFNIHTDEQLWQALKQAHLADWVKTLDAGLQHECTEGGENLSIGQRQLVCLARALLRKTKVLILDEATAACDVETDELIQSTIRSEFSQCTVLTVAHRLNTIMDYDKIMVLGAGEILEMDTPKNLLSNHQSVFYSMAKDSGLVE